METKDIEKKVSLETEVKQEKNVTLKDPKRSNFSYYRALNLKDQLLDPEDDDDDEGGIISYYLWLPFLTALKIFNIWLNIITFPIYFPIEKLFGKKIERVNLGSSSLTQKKQTAIVAVVVYLPFLFLPLVLTTLGLLLFPLTTIPVAIFLYFSYDNGEETGKRTPKLRYARMWRHFARYYPLKLIKTADLDADKSYVFCYHPHGIISMGAFGNFATDATGFSRKFPGIDLRLLTLLSNFRIPMYREYLLSMGLCGASKKACNTILNRNKGKGNGIMLVVGGAQESLDAKPGTYRLTLSRKGFVRVALNNRAELIPVLGFGETDVYDSYVYDKKTWVRKFQVWFKRNVGFAPPLFNGRGIFNYSIGLLPYRRPIFTVVGKPVEFPKRFKDDPNCQVDEKLVGEYHAEYVKALMELYDAFKNQWAANRSESLRIIDAKRQKSMRLESLIRQDLQQSSEERTG
eukprot:maker-scaffold_31-snap-gene-1.1-mRNA-1 protein AED:0.01 eAED:0.01 QI:114/1/1/1/1/1/2/102/459